MAKSFGRLSKVLGGVSLFVALSLPMVGCSEYYLDEGAPLLTTASVDGAWTRLGPNGVVAEYLFTSDGTFTAKSIPSIRAPHDGVGNLKVDWDVSMNGSGTWSIEKNDQDPPVIDLEYDQASLPAFEPENASDDDGDYGELLSIEQNHVKGLFLVAGDGDLKFRLIFHKVKG